ncbi:MAG: sodium:alanine symporter family protein [Ruminococcus sp.]|mgnify:FL=1|jgi:AGCS family alanine or glycine:cation symporter|nr:sodium:alanine symporter family protein [Ruminococcus sp.]
MDKLNEIVSKIDGFVWGLPLILLIITCGIILSIRIGFLQIHKLKLSLKYMLKNEDEGHGDVSSIGALCTALSATVGTGNIVGVATAIAAGGPGALFWMEIAAFFGMATKYSEGLLAIKYRKVDSEGHILGGPFYYIEDGLGKNWKWLGKLFAVFGMFVGLMGIGTFTQINGITSAANGFFDKSPTTTIFGREYTYTTIIVGLIVTVLVAFIVIGGIKRIASVSQVVVPVMILIYLACCIIIIFSNITKIPDAVVTVVKSAFGIRPAIGGIVGTAMISAMRNGVARGIFSNEAGLGSAPIAAAAAKTKEPVRQGLVTMTGTFIDTIIVCTMTGLSIVMAGSYKKESLEGVQITTDAFCEGLPFPEKFSAFLLMICLAFFAFTTILGWNYYSERCLSYLTGSNKIATIVFRWLYVAAVFIGPYLTVEAVWNIADIFNGLMALPNVIALIALSGVAARETKEFFSRYNKKDGTIAEKEEVPTK